MVQDMTLVEQYRKKIYRIGWKIQYRAKVQTNHEHLMEKNELASVDSFVDAADSRMYILQLLESLPSSMGKTIIYELYMNDKTETQVARELNLSQQAVNKWKKKMLHQLSCQIKNLQS
ncbi:sigma-70 RNA polymerase sigma factor region 4 domain-containing protein [Paenibacillus pini]|uniref:RNA polymerase sigma factor 70 region 4 type 2 domain-containing protein n=1 Tax=Paenibacillus pini JCM 16418 TaxID=1236976 RepID=W7YME1_9BACL|nr:hypothetical protein [Paenibacillus pini]GAF08783.1 hypothetical protein JCM16418_2888 [Paenibacillus pini JCM 16418]